MGMPLNRSTWKNLATKIRIFNRFNADFKAANEPSKGNTTNIGENTDYCWCGVAQRNQSMRKQIKDMR
jgi:hypothetical protein